MKKNCGTSIYVWCYDCEVAWKGSSLTCWSCEGQGYRLSVYDAEARRLYDRFAHGVVVSDMLSGERRS